MLLEIEKFCCCSKFENVIKIENVVPKLGGGKRRPYKIIFNKMLKNQFVTIQRITYRKRIMMSDA